MGQHNGRRSGVALPEHEEARQQGELAQAMMRERAEAEFRAQVQRVAGQVASGLALHEGASDVASERIADDAIRIARAIVVRSIGVGIPTAAEVQGELDRRTSQAKNTAANEQREPAQ